MLLAHRNDSQLLAEVLSFFDEFSSEDRFVLAISGGMDSMTLLNILSKADTRLISRICVAHLHHGIREASDWEYERVCQISKRYGFHFYGEKRNIPQLLSCKYKGRSIEDAAREERKEFFQYTLELWKAHYIVTAHHQDDLLETFLMRLIRGTGLSGYECMKKKDGRYLRPLLSYWKEQIAHYAKNEGIEYYEDVSNRDDRYLRNRVRNRLIPFLSENFGSTVKDVMIRDQLLLSDSSVLVESLLTPFMDSIKLSENEARISWRVIAPYSDSVLRELFIRLLRKWKSNTRGIDSEKLFSITQRSREPGNFSISLSGGLRFFREYDNCGFSENRNESHRFSEDSRVFMWDDPAVPLTILMDANKKISLRVEDVERPAPKTLEEAEKHEMAFFDKECVLFPLSVRFARPGDVFVPLGSKRSKKVARFCIDQKIPNQQRKDMLLLLDKKNDIIWCIGIRISDSVRITSDTRRFVRIVKCTSLF